MTFCPFMRSQLPNQEASCTCAEEAILLEIGPVAHLDRTACGEDEAKGTICKKIERVARESRKRYRRSDSFNFLVLVTTL